MTKRFLSLFDLAADELRQLLARAVELKALKVKGGLPQPLAGQVWAMIFEKPSMRTRVSFETGVALLGGRSIFMTQKHVQPGKREPLKDMGRVLSRYVDGLILRTFSHEMQESLAQWSTIPVINGLSDRSHPCQVLADLLTVQERRGSFRDLKAAWIGDGNNMAYSWIAAAIQLGFSLSLACPPGYEPDKEIVDRARRDGAAVEVVNDPVKAVQGAGVINTDTWTSMGQEEEAQVRRQAFAGFQVNSALVAQALPEVMVLHCLPAHRGEEITDEVIEGSQSAVFDQAENRLHAQMALLEAMSG